jgi:hypothetical protein
MQNYDPYSMSNAMPVLKFDPFGFYDQPSDLPEISPTAQDDDQISVKKVENLIASEEGKEGTASVSVSLKFG